MIQNINNVIGYVCSLRVYHWSLYESCEFSIGYCMHYLGHVNWSKFIFHNIIKFILLHSLHYYTFNIIMPHNKKKNVLAKTRYNSSNVSTII